MPAVPFLEGIQYSSQIGVYAFSSAIILILLYLMRPKPIEKDIPSLMFFMREKGFSKRTAFFRRLFSNLLFLLQLIILVLLASAMTEPFTTIQGELAIENTIIVLDTSASMQTGSRFQEAITESKGLLKGRISIVLAQNVPLVALEMGTKEEALRVLGAAQPKDTTSNIGDAMMLAADLLKDRKGKVYVISDFLPTEGPDPIVAKRILTAKGIPVEFKLKWAKASNLGIIEMTPGKSTTKAMVKNYNDKEKTVSISIMGEKETRRMQKKLLANSIDTFEFTTMQGSTEIRIDEKDDLDVDNHAYLSAQGIKKIKVLLVTNQDKSHLKTALLSSKDIELAIAEPPVVKNLDYDIIIMHSFSPSLLLPDFYKEVLLKVRNGSSLIITSQDSIKDVDKSIMPVEIGESHNFSKISSTISNEFTTDVDFGSAFRYYNSTPVDGAVVIAQADKSPVMVMNEMGLGKIIYYGLIDEQSDFKTTVFYPIFWGKLINFLTQTEDLNEYNFKTGKIYPAPSGKQYLDKAALYTFGEKKISASLLSEKESEISLEPKQVFDEEKKLAISKAQEKRDVKFELYLVIAVVAMVLLELLYIKWRGDV